MAAAKSSVSPGRTHTAGLSTKKRPLRPLPDIIYPSPNLYQIVESGNALTHRPAISAE